MSASNSYDAARGYLEQDITDVNSMITELKTELGAMNQIRVLMMEELNRMRR